jgi:hypothetical protein
MASTLFTGIRSSVAVQNRLFKTEQIVQIFIEKRNLDAGELSNILGFSPSGTRKYIRDLIAEKVISVYLDGCSGKSMARQTIYMISNDKKHVDDFIKRLREASDGITAHLKPQSRASNPRKQKVQPTEEGRRVFILDDEAPTGVRTKKNEGEGKRDFMVSAFFGPSRTVNA